MRVITAPLEVRIMNIFKLDLMTLLVIVVLLGVVVTMTTQASSRSKTDNAYSELSVQSESYAVIKR